MSSTAYERPLLFPSPTRSIRVSWRGERSQERGRRILNVGVAAAALIVSFPFMLLIAALIKLSSRGPVLFSQTRVGLNRRDPLADAGNSRRKLDYGGRPFTIYKFRTMQWQPESGEAQVWARPDDPRVTKLGRILRKYRLDELPQFFNVLRGDMNIVGPRPEQPEILLKLKSQIEGYELRQLVRPGITGWAQINLHYDTTVEDVRRKVSYDLQYVARPSVLEDLKIMLQTAPVVVFRRGAW
jgi:lipopolysaccharide/colanic/teichoic acid biosynthesis glycosyltransferase